MADADILLNANPASVCYRLFWALCFILSLPVLIILSPLLVIQSVICFIKSRAYAPLSWALEDYSLVPLGVFDEKKLPPPPDVPESLKDVTRYEVDGNKTYAVVDIEDPAKMVRTTCDIMLKATLVPSTYDLPEDLQGIFWMRGNLVPEILACLNYSTFEKLGETKYRFTRAGTYCGWAVLNTKISKSIAVGNASMFPNSMTWFDFDDATLNYGQVFACKGLEYTIKSMFLLGRWTLERLPGPGVNFKRGCYWLPGWFGEWFSFGSYHLVKVMTADGVPVQPAYDDLVKYLATDCAGLKLMLGVQTTSSPEIHPSSNSYTPLQQE